MEAFLFYDAVVDIGLIATSYTISEDMGSVSVCVDISSAQLARNVSVTLRSVTAGTAVGKLTCRNTIIMCTSYILQGIGLKMYMYKTLCIK